MHSCADKQWWMKYIDQNNIVNACTENPARFFDVENETDEGQMSPA
jgi:hypothetical protein